MGLKAFCVVLVSLIFGVAESSNQNAGGPGGKLTNVKVIADNSITEKTNVRETSVEALDFLHFESSCNCGSNSFCETDIYGKKVCICNPEYGYKSGICEPCNCGLGINCTFDKHGKHCDCPVEYEDYEGFCKANNSLTCDCGRGANCTFKSGGMIFCQCPKGYELVRGRCEDIDECQNPTLYPCYAPGWWTRCRNIRGSYRCDCLVGGYGGNPWRESSREPEDEHCEDLVKYSKITDITLLVSISIIVIAAVIAAFIVDYKKNKKYNVQGTSCLKNILCSRQSTNMTTYTKKNADSVI